MIRKYQNRIQTKIRKLIGKDWLGKLDTIERRVLAGEGKIQRKQMRVLIGPSFVMWEPSFALDKSLSLALRLRGVDVIPMYCDSIQHVECNFIGGDWGNCSKSCKDCKKRSEKLWQYNPNKPLPFSRYISPSDIEQISAIISDLTFDDALCFQKSGVAYGAMAKDIMVNNYLVATPTLVENHEYLLKVHLQNLLMVSLAYERILDDQKPDRVVSNDSYYGMWAVLEQHCKARSIPFYSHWPVTRNRVAFAQNDAAMNLDFTKSWNNFSKIDLTTEDDKRINKWLSGERGLVFDTTKLGSHEIHDPIVDTIDPLKPTIVLAANVIWDLAALNKQIVFKDMNEWIVETIEWFRGKDNFQLIIRPHPVETSPQIAKTKETVAAVIELSAIQLPRNVFLLKSDAKVTLKDLIVKCKVRGITVHTTTVGFEYPAQGLPVVTTAKSPYRGFGFTIDPDSKQEYFQEINDLLTGEQKLVPQTSQLLARKFTKFYQFHYYCNIGLFINNPPDLANNYSDLLGKKGGPFDYVVNSIIEGLPINSENRWLPET